MNAETAAAAARRGRRAGDSRTRETILRVALDGFAHQGFSGTTMRQIAVAAGVDPSLVTHFYGSKEALLIAALESAAATVPARLTDAVRANPGDVARQLARAFFASWEHPLDGLTMRAIARAGTESAAVAELVRHQLEVSVVGIAEVLPGTSVATAQAVLSQLFGTAYARYIFRVHPLADLAFDELVELTATTLRLSRAHPPTEGT